MTPEEYRVRERAALRHLPNRLIQACRPVTFDEINYPTRTSDVKSLWRWADVMHECRFEKDFPEKLGSLTPDEWLLWQQITKAVYRETKRLECGIVPRGSLLRALYTFRQIETFDLLPQVIVEIGPGSGYLTALLDFFNYDVIAVEVSQAFFLWQERLMACLGLNGTKHLSWWEFYVKDQTYLRPNLVVANHCLCEMSQDCLVYLARLCQAWNTPILCEGLGLQKQRTELEALREFGRRGVEVLGVIPHFPSPKGISLEEVLAYQTQLLGGDPRTPDEVWLQALYGKDYYS